VTAPQDLRELYKANEIGYICRKWIGSFVMITRFQCRAARGLLAWTQRELSGRARVAIPTIRQFEAGKREPRRATLDVIERAFEGAGVEFIEAGAGGGAGLRLKEGQEHFQTRRKVGRRTVSE
jgi:transcriptional regulator with XRE-family HTH domain